MENLSDLTKRLYRHKFVRYLIVGGSTFIIDFGLLYFFKTKVHLDLAAATSIGYWVGVTYNFFLNRWWSFSATEKSSLARHAAIYCVLLGFNYLFTVIFVDLLSHHISYLLAKALAVLIQMSWTYIVYKNYIFVKREPKNTTSDKGAATSKD